MERMTSPNYTDPREPLQFTLALIRPEAMCYRDAITDRIYEAGFKIVDTTIVKLTAEQAAHLYGDQRNQANFALKMVTLCAGPVQALCLSKPMAIKELLALLGDTNDLKMRSKWPGSLRSYFGSTGVQNGILGSVDLEHARAEIEFFFPHISIDPVMVCPKEQERYLNSFVYPVLMDGIYAMAKDQPEDCVLELAKWLFRNNPNRPSVCDTSINLVDEIELMKAEESNWKAQQCDCGEDADSTLSTIEEIFEDDCRRSGCSRNV